MPASAGSILGGGDSNLLSDDNVLAGLWADLAICAALVLAYCCLQRHSSLFRYRLTCPAVTTKPPPLATTGIRAYWDWAVQAATASDLTLLQSAGLDALVMAKTCALGLQLFGPACVLGLAVLLPVHRLAAGPQQADAAATPAFPGDGSDARSGNDTAGANGTLPDGTDAGEAFRTARTRGVLWSLSMANLPYGSHWLWLHFFFVVAWCLWATWLLRWHYRQFAIIRTHYLRKGDGFNVWRELYAQPAALGGGLPRRHGPASRRRPGGGGQGDNGGRGKLGLGVAGPVAHVGELLAAGAAPLLRLMLPMELPQLRTSAHQQQLHAAHTHDLAQGQPQGQPQEWTFSQDTQLTEAPSRLFSEQRSTVSQAQQQGRRLPPHGWERVTGQSAFTHAGHVLDSDDVSSRDGGSKASSKEASPARDVDRQRGQQPRRAPAVVEMQRLRNRRASAVRTGSSGASLAPAASLPLSLAAGPAASLGGTTAAAPAGGAVNPLSVIVNPRAAPMLAGAGASGIALQVSPRLLGAGSMRSICSRRGGGLLLSPGGSGTLAVVAAPGPGGQPQVGLVAVPSTLEAARSLPPPAYLTTQGSARVREPRPAPTTSTTTGGTRVTPRAPRPPLATPRGAGPRDASQPDHARARDQRDQGLTPRGSATLRPSGSVAEALDGDFRSQYEPPPPPANVPQPQPQRLRSAQAEVRRPLLRPSPVREDDSGTGGSCTPSAHGADRAPPPCYYSAFATPTGAAAAEAVLLACSPPPAQPPLPPPALPAVPFLPGAQGALPVKAPQAPHPRPTKASKGAPGYQALTQASTPSPPPHHRSSARWAYEAVQPPAQRPPRPASAGDFGTPKHAASSSGGGAAAATILHSAAAGVEERRSPTKAVPGGLLGPLSRRFLGLGGGRPGSPLRGGGSPLRGIGSSPLRSAAGPDSGGLRQALLGPDGDRDSGGSGEGGGDGTTGEDRSSQESTARSPLPPPLQIPHPQLPQPPPAPQTQQPQRPQGGAARSPASGGGLVREVPSITIELASDGDSVTASATCGGGRNSKGRRARGGSDRTSGHVSGGAASRTRDSNQRHSTGSRGSHQRISNESGHYSRGSDGGAGEEASPGADSHKAGGTGWRRLLGRWGRASPGSGGRSLLPPTAPRSSQPGATPPVETAVDTQGAGGAASEDATPTQSPRGGSDRTAAPQPRSGLTPAAAAAAALLPSSPVAAGEVGGPVSPRPVSVGAARAVVARRALDRATPGSARRASQDRSAPRREGAGADVQQAVAEEAQPESDSGPLSGLDSEAEGGSLGSLGSQSMGIPRWWARQPLPALRPTPAVVAAAAAANELLRRNPGTPTAPGSGGGASHNAFSSRRATAGGAGTSGGAGSTPTAAVAERDSQRRLLLRAAAAAANAHASAAAGTPLLYPGSALPGGSAERRSGEEITAAGEEAPVGGGVRQLSWGGAEDDGADCDAGGPAHEDSGYYADPYLADLGMGMEVDPNNLDLGFGAGLDVGLDLDLHRPSVGHRKTINAVWRQDGRLASVMAQHYAVLVTGVRQPLYGPYSDGEGEATAKDPRRRRQANAQSSAASSPGVEPRKGSSGAAGEQATPERDRGAGSFSQSLTRITHYMGRLPGCLLWGSGSAAAQGKALDASSLTAVSALAVSDVATAAVALMATGNRRRSLPSPGPAGLGVGLARPSLAGTSRAPSSVFLDLSTAQGLAVGSTGAAAGPSGGTGGGRHRRTRSAAAAVTAGMDFGAAAAGAAPGSALRLPKLFPHGSPVCRTPGANGMAASLEQSPRVQRALLLAALAAAGQRAAAAAAANGVPGGSGPLHVLPAATAPAAGAVPPAARAAPVRKFGGHMRCVSEITPGEVAAALAAVDDGALAAPKSADAGAGRTSGKALVAPAAPDKVSGATCLAHVPSLEGSRRLVASPASYDELPASGGGGFSGGGSGSGARTAAEGGGSGRADPCDDGDGSTAARPTAAERWAFVREAVECGAVAALPYSKRFCVVSATFGRLFPEDFDRAVPVVNHRQVDQLLRELDLHVAEYEQAREHYRVTGERPLGRVGGPGRLGCLAACCGPPRDLIRHHRERVAQVKEQVLAARRAALCAPRGTGSWLVFFRSQQAAATAAQCAIFAEGDEGRGGGASCDGCEEGEGDGRCYFKVMPAPGPDEVNWPALWLSPRQRAVRSALVLPLALLLLLAVPVGLFSGGLQQLSAMLCTPVETESASGSATELAPLWPWYCAQHSGPARVLKRLVVGWLPALLISLWQGMVLPVVCWLLVQSGGLAFSLSEADRRVASYLFLYDVFNAFLGGVVGSALVQSLRTALYQGPSALLALLGGALPTSSNFFLSYLAFRALVAAPLRLLIPHVGVRLYLLRRYCRWRPRARRGQGRGQKRGARSGGGEDEEESSGCFLGCGGKPSEREAAVMYAPVSPRYGYEVGMILLVFVVSSAFLVVAPVLLPAAMAFFAAAWLFWRHALLYVYVRQYEGGGGMWDLVFGRLAAVVALAAAFSGAALLARGGTAQGVLLLAGAPPMLLRFASRVSRRYRRGEAAMPLDLAADAPTASVDPWVYMPPPLHHQAAGWHPDWAVPWRGWNLPPYGV